MKTIYKIAKAELNLLFCSPIAWLVLVVFTFQVSMDFSTMFLDNLKDAAMGKAQHDLTVMLLFSGFGKPLFPSVYSWLMLFFPLLTMGLMSKEFSSGSVNLLFSSPITSAQIILGKFLAMMLYGLVMMGIIIVYVVYYAFVIKDIDLPLVCSGLLGVYLMMGLYSAIGLFISSLTSYQVVAAILTFAFLTFWNMLGGLLQGYDFWRDITYWLCMGTHNLGNGLINTDDLFYFVLVPAMFLAFAVLKLQLMRQRDSVWMRIGKYLAVFVVTCAIGYTSSRLGNMKFWDVSRNEQLTLTPESQEILSRFDSTTLKMTTYVNIMDEHTAEKVIPSNRNNDIRCFGMYLRFRPDIEMNYVYYYDEITGEHAHCDQEELEKEARHIARQNRIDFSKILSPEEMKEIRDLSAENNRVVRVLEDGDGQETYLRMFNDLAVYPGEQEISIALKRLNEGAVRIGFLSGHGERELDKAGDRDYGTLREPSSRGSLINQGFDMVPVPLTDDTDIPEDLDILVVSDAREAYSPVEMEKLKQYIASGRNMVILTDVNRQQTMGELLELVGVKARPGCVVQHNEDYAPAFLYAGCVPGAADIDPVFGRYIGRWPLIMHGAVALEYTRDKGFDVYPFFCSTAESWNELETTDIIREAPVYRPEAAEQKQAYLTALALKRQVGERQQRILVFGDADWMSKAELAAGGRTFVTANNALITPIFQWMAYHRYPQYFNRPQQPDNQFCADYEYKGMIKFCFIVLFPLILLTVYMGIWWKRKKI